MSDDALLLDTHIWFRYQVNPKILRASTVDAIDHAALRNAVFVSAISVWELAMLEREGKLELYGGADRWAEEALSKPGISLLPLSPQIAVAAVYLPDPMHKDPSDRILVASARVERMTFVTSDKKILHFAKDSGLPCLKG
jgi:PIN domain nuclease of toxin-antitoxin system